MNWGTAKYAFLAAALATSACGTQIPDLANTPLEQAFTEMDLINHIKCEIHLGVREALRVWKKGGAAGGNGVEWLRNWQAKVTLVLTVDEKTSFNPGISLTDPMHNVISYFSKGGPVVSQQSFAAGLGLQASAQAVRTETLAFTFLIADLLKYDPLDKQADSCDGQGRVPVIGTLKIDEFIVAKAGIAASPDTVPNNGTVSPFTVFSDQTKFIVVFGGSANPVWKLVNLTANAGLQGAPLFQAVRTRTQDVMITMGKIDSKEVTAVFQANLIGQAVSSSLERIR